MVRTISITIAAALIAPALFAQTAPAKSVAPVNEFRVLDKNQDGRISLSESQSKAELQTAFESLDRNADGYLTPTEFAGWSGSAPTTPASPETAPGGSAGAQHMPKND